MYPRDAYTTSDMSLHPIQIYVPVYGHPVSVTAYLTDCGGGGEVVTLLHTHDAKLPH